MSLLERLLSFRKRIDQNHSINCNQILDSSYGQHTIFLNQSTISEHSISNSTEMLLFQLENDGAIQSARVTIKKLLHTVEKMYYSTMKESYTSIKQYQPFLNIRKENKQIKNSVIPANAFSKKKSSICINTSQPLKVQKPAAFHNYFYQQRKLLADKFDQENIPSQCPKRSIFSLNPSFQDLNDNINIFLSENLQQSATICKNQNQTINPSLKNSEFSLYNFRQRINDIKNKHNLKQVRNISIKQTLNLTQNAISKSKSNSPLVYHQINTDNKFSTNVSLAEDDSSFFKIIKKSRNNKENMSSKAFTNSFQSLFSSIEKERSVSKTKSRKSLNLLSKDKSLSIFKEPSKLFETTKVKNRTQIKRCQTKKYPVKLQKIQKTPAKLFVNLLPERNWKQLYEQQKKSFLKNNSSIGLKKVFKQQRSSIVNKKSAKKNALREVFLDLNI